MSNPRRRVLAIARHLAVPALAVGVLAALPLGGTPAGQPQPAGGRR